MTTRKMKINGFTLVELLVVIAIIGILIGMLLPAVQQVREAARRSACSNNVKQMSLGMMNYESAFMRFPPGIKSWDFTDEAGATAALKTPGLAWSAIILPFIEQNSLWESISRLSKGTSAPLWIDTTTTPNINYATKVVAPFICPSDDMDVINTVRPSPTSTKEAKSNYVGILGFKMIINVDQITNFSQFTRNETTAVTTNKARWEAPLTGVLYQNSKVTMGDITDGTSNTFLVGERDGSFLSDTRTRGAATWCGAPVAPYLNQCLAATSSGASQTINSASNNNNSKWWAISSLHPGGVTFGRADGSVGFISETISGTTYESLGTKADGEIVGDIN